MIAAPPSLTAKYELLSATSGSSPVGVEYLPAAAVNAAARSATRSPIATAATAL